MFYYIPGHNFGLVAAVLNFSRFPRLMVAMSRSLFALLVDQYFDDYMLVNTLLAGSSGQECLAFLHNTVNHQLDPRNISLPQASVWASGYASTSHECTPTCARSSRALGVVACPSW